MDALAVGASVALGLAVGSFLNVVIHRVPRDESIVRPRSRCPACGTSIAARDNIPLLSFFLLHGRCRACGERISPRYPIVEALTAALFGVTAVRFGWNDALPAFLVFTAVLIAVSAVDLELRRIPTPIVWTGFVTGLALLGIATLGTTPHRWWPLARGLIGAAACGAVFLAIALVVPKGMGMGDVRLVTLEGLFLGWLGPAIPIVGIFLGFLIGSVCGIGLMLARRAGRKSQIPFGPFLASGAFAALLFGQQLVNTYRGI
jgi:leader peptidase (prepilin peptidase) / N-methyltransferase